MIPIEHADHIVIEREKHVDLIDPETGRWQQFKTIRSAKWNAAVYTRIRKGFGICNNTPKTS